MRLQDGVALTFESALPSNVTVAAEDVIDSITVDEETPRGDGTNDQPTVDMERSNVAAGEAQHYFTLLCTRLLGERVGSQCACRPFRTEPPGTKERVRHSASVDA